MQENRAKTTGKKARRLPCAVLAAWTLIALTACTDQPDTGGAPDTVKREFTINGTFYRTINGTVTPYTAAITLIDQTKGSVDLAEQGIAPKLEQAFANIAEGTQTNITMEQNAYTVLPRGVKIQIVNAAETFNGFQALNSTTVRCHIDFLTTTNAALIAGYFEAALFVLAGIAHP
jgi:hypothetical protein